MKTIFDLILILSNEYWESTQTIHGNSTAEVRASPLSLGHNMWESQSIQPQSDEHSNPGSHATIMAKYGQALTAESELDACNEILKPCISNIASSLSRLSYIL